MNMCRFSSNLCFSHVHVIRTSPGEEAAGQASRSGANPRGFGQDSENRSVTRW